MLAMSPEREIEFYAIQPRKKAILCHQLYETRIRHPAVIDLRESFTRVVEVNGFGGLHIGYEFGAQHSHCVAVDVGWRCNGCG